MIGSWVSVLLPLTRTLRAFHYVIEVSSLVIDTDVTFKIGAMSITEGMKLGGKVTGLIDRLEIWAVYSNL